MRSRPTSLFRSLRPLVVITTIAGVLAPALASLGATPLPLRMSSSDRLRSKSRAFVPIVPAMPIVGVESPEAPEPLEDDEANNEAETETAEPLDWLASVGGRRLVDRRVLGERFLSSEDRTGSSQSIRAASASNPPRRPLRSVGLATLLCRPLC